MESSLVPGDRNGDVDEGQEEEDSASSSSLPSIETFDVESRVCMGESEVVVSQSSDQTQNDFLPIKTEIKKMGVEISDERAEQLKNDVRRLSPEVVSLRERTLGEISLTPDSSFFETSATNEDDGEERLSMDNEDKNDDKLSSSSSPSSNIVNNDDERSTNTQFPVSTSLPKSDDQVPSNIDCSKLAMEPRFTRDCDSVSVSVHSNERLNTFNTEEDKSRSENVEEVPTTQQNSLLSTKTIQKLAEDEEIVFGGASNVAHVQQLQSSSSSSSCFSSSSSSTCSASSSPISCSNNPLGFIVAYPEASPCSSSESTDQDPLGDHGETETDSDSSERTVSSLENKVLMVNNDEGVRVDDVESISMSAELQRIAENDVCSTDSGTEIVIIDCDRIEPGQFTEDSAESLALAPGTNDEVRSDGSDSGLGGEINGDNGNQGPAPESDSETSFLDRIPDEILSDKDKTDAFVPVPGSVETVGSCQIQRPVHLPTPILPALRNPPKSNLKRRLTDCMEGEPNPKRSNPDESQKKKRNIHFDAVTVYYFPRAQGFTCVPSQGGSTLGMSAAHTHAERFSLTEHAAEQRRIHRARLAQLRSERAANNIVEAASSSEDPSDDTDEEPSDAEELDIDSYYFLLPVPTWQRRALLRAAGVQKIDTVEKDECRDIRASRKHCGCGCKGYCDPESCPCSRAHVKCQVDRAGFPCGCSRDGCANSSGRIEFNPVRVRTHFIHTLMRLELEKKHRDEDCGDLRDLESQSSLQGALRDVRGHPVVGMQDINDASCSINGSGFTTLHYQTSQDVVSCQPDIPGTREDSLDLYAIRDDCYPTSEDAVDGVSQVQTHQHHHQRKLLHPPEFAQSFQAFPLPGTSPAQVQQFQQNSYQDYQAYQTLPSTSRAQFHAQFQPPHSAPGFSHYGAYVADSGMSAGCHQSQQNVYEGSFPQDDGAPSQYTNLQNSVQPLISNNSVVHTPHQQMGKLEPFSELLAGRYSYYGEVEPSQGHGTGTVYQGGSGKSESEKTTVAEIGLGQENVGHNPAAPGVEECDENFGEIIKKSMVETVSA